MASGGALLLVVAAVLLFFPRVLTIPLAVVGTWVACSLLVRAYRLNAGARAPAPPRTDRTSPEQKAPQE